MTDDIKIIQIESEVTTIKADIATLRAGQAALQSDIRELKAHDKASDAKQTEILTAVYKVGERIISVEARTVSAERKLIEQKGEQKELAIKLSDQNEAQLGMLRAIQDEQIRRSAEKAYGEKAISRIPLLITLTTVLGAVLNWYLVSKGSK